MDSSREQFKTRLGFILIAAGCAVGIGNVWRFPYIVGQYGGAFFVLIYLFFLIAMGIPLLTVELAVVVFQSGDQFWWFRGRGNWRVDSVLEKLVQDI